MAKIKEGKFESCPTFCLHNSKVLARKLLMFYPSFSELIIQRLSNVSSNEINFSAAHLTSKSKTNESVETRDSAFERKGTSRNAWHLSNGYANRGGHNNSKQSKNNNKWTNKQQKVEENASTIVSLPSKQRKVDLSKWAKRKPKVSTVGFIKSTTEVSSPTRKGVSLDKSAVHSSVKANSSHNSNGDDNGGSVKSSRPLNPQRMIAPTGLIRRAYRRTQGTFKNLHIEPKQATLPTPSHADNEPSSPKQIALFYGAHPGYITQSN
ncbi:hypothetical protein RFI_08962 [Reticulomyxa filosa]|uniref:Uncharacterized protein n=1 Tax=Reticulomyxa filosa TaxID=46433 RepID=X6NPF4_RETFI|nr:hypothetical protein RFI_08962 [Reticulomyxa filosa]|eukprot:ETO28170.1 hypothetical protein RFI_08962 [Reticulomyxa filosa]